MNIYFKAKTNKDYCMINTAVFVLKGGGTVTIDRDETEYSIENGVLTMVWINPYIWKINDVQVSDDLSYISEDFVDLLRQSRFAGFELEDDADSDYVVTDVGF